MKYRFLRFLPLAFSAVPGAFGFRLGIWRGSPRPGVTAAAGASNMPRPGSAPHFGHSRSATSPAGDWNNDPQRPQ